MIVLSGPYVVQSFNEVALLNDLHLKDTNKEARSLRQELDLYKKEHSSLIEHMKESVREDYPQRITKELRLVKAVHIKSNEGRVH